mgnify:CR=1 FL=1
MGGAHSADRGVAGHVEHGGIDPGGAGGKRVIRPAFVRHHLPALRQQTQIPRSISLRSHRPAHHPGVHPRLRFPADLGTLHAAGHPGDPAAQRGYSVLPHRSKRQPGAAAHGLLQEEDEPLLLCPII